MVDFTDIEKYYKITNALHIEHISSGTSVRFAVKNGNKTSVVSGVIRYIDNIENNTFMIVEHYDKDKSYARDYVYSSFDHAFTQINKEGNNFVEWNKSTLVKSAHAPYDYKLYWNLMNKVK